MPWPPHYFVLRTTSARQPVLARRWSNGLTISFVTAPWPNGEFMSACDISTSTPPVTLPDIAGCRGPKVADTLAMPLRLYGLAVASFKRRPPELSDGRTPARCTATCRNCWKRNTDAALRTPSPLMFVQSFALLLLPATVPASLCGWQSQTRAPRHNKASDNAPPLCIIGGLGWPAACLWRLFRPASVSSIPIPAVWSPSQPSPSRQCDVGQEPHYYPL